MKKGGIFIETLNKKYKDQIIKFFTNDEDFYTSLENLYKELRIKGGVAFLSNEFFNEKKKMLILLNECGGKCLQYASNELKKDKDIVLEAIKRDGTSLMFANPKFQNDEEIVRIAIEKDGRALAFVSDRFKDNKELVLKAVKNDALALSFASDRLKNDKEVVIAAINSKLNGKVALSFAHPNIKDNKEINEIINK